MIAKNELITYYDGERIDYSVARSRDPSHIRSVAFGHEAIDGLREPAAGRGAGSFCNHSDRPNARYHTRDDCVWIKALRDIHPGEEVLVSYGKTYWKRLPTDV
jgi:SET domain-containing protein